MECLGGNGYVEESIMPRLYREAPVNAIWEGSGNVMCLDVLRALKGEEERALFQTLAHEAGVEESGSERAGAKRSIGASHSGTAGAAGECGGTERERAAASGRSFCSLASRRNAWRALRRTGHRPRRDRTPTAARLAGTLIAALRRLQIRFCQAVERALKNKDRGVLIDHLLALGAADINVDERALNRGG